MSRLLRIVTLAMLTAFAAMPALAQTAPVKPKSPSEIAAADKVAMEKRANCEREARANKLSYLKRHRFVQGCIRR
jgi:indole-3-glycerol phosphate synthase